MRFHHLIIVGLAFAPRVALADPAAMARDFADKFAVPRFQAVAVAAHAQQAAWTAFCNDRKRGDTRPLKRAFNDVADAWADVEFVRTGPAAIALRVERFNYWLDRTGATDKALNAMLSDPEVPSAEKLQAASVAGQGMPILERLLYDKGTNEIGRCKVGQAVAGNLVAIADAIASDWTAPDGARAALIANTRWRFAFADSAEAANIMLTDLASGLEGLKDFKVAMLLHDATDPEAPRLAEGVRSHRTIRDIERNLAAIHEGLGVFLAAASAEQRKQLDTAFDDALRALKNFETAKRSTRAASGPVMRTAFAVLGGTVIAVLPEATGLTLGFNNLDGD